MAYTAWSDLYYGGKTEERTMANKTVRTVVLERFVIHRGEIVTKGKLGVSDEEWDVLIASGSVRSYPLPEEADDYTSPSQAIMRRLMKDGEIDPNILLEMSLTHPPVINPPADKADVPVGA